ncbi:hypothetical protein B0T14DRAFT_539810 [Immersiella caudata]|uniref:Uncharacterized protein n=1 Tax=Immersiella caudata TaxID=314043 RepID=A0AA40BUK8_9PEZI|nr:hypothetical protein B0T14DRAFT_539810 [Immersiella caudata]
MRFTHLSPDSLPPWVVGAPHSSIGSLGTRAMDYEDEVCHPVVQHSNDTIPPCLSLVTIETLCTPNGTSPLALKAHQQCMCSGSFFSEWPFCLQCLFVHGLRSERDLAFYKSVISTASSSLCAAPTPTAEFASIFSDIQVAAPYPTTGETVSSDQAVGNTAVSLYFTATTRQGPGQITGAATAATASVLFTAPPISPPVGPFATGSDRTGNPSSTNTAAGAGGSSRPSGAGSAAPSTKADKNVLVAALAAVAIFGGAILS